MPRLSHPTPALEGLVSPLSLSSPSRIGKMLVRVDWRQSEVFWPRPGRVSNAHALPSVLKGNGKLVRP
jgi:hypothetical protein